MERGTLEEIVLGRSVIKHIRKHNKNIQVGASVGNDYSLVMVDDQNGIISAEGLGYSPNMAWVKALNNFATSGGALQGVRIIMLLPENICENDIKIYMSEFNDLADNSMIQIMGGHTEVSEAYSEVSFIVEAVGSTDGYFPRPKNIKVGYNIVMTKYTGLYGNDYLIDNYRNNLEARLAKSYIENAYHGMKEYLVIHEAEICKQMDDVYYMHDVSHGGVYGALWQLSKRINKGISVDHFAVPIKQHTIEICEVVDINPYMIDGTGSLLTVCSNGEKLVDTLMNKGIHACVIGNVTEDKESVIKIGHEKRYLSPIKGDEIYRKR